PMRTPSRLLLLAFSSLLPLSVAQAQNSARPHSPKREVQILVQRSKTLVQNQRFAQAERLLETQLKSNPNSTNQIPLRNALADVHYAWGQHQHHWACTIAWRGGFKWRGSGFEQAVLHFKRAYSTDKVLRPNKAIHDLLGISNAYIQDNEANAKGDNKNAALYSQWALNLSRKSHDILGQATSLRNLGWLSQMLNHNSQALRYSEQSLALYRRLPYTRIEQGWRLHNIGYIHRKMGDFDKEIRTNTEVRQIFRSINFSLGLGYAWSNLGNCYAELGRFDKALPCFQSAQVHFQRDTSYEGPITSRLNLIDIGWCYMGLKQYQKALNIFQKAVPLSIKNRDTFAQINVFLNMGDTYIRLERYSQAELSYKQCLTALQIEPSSVYGGLCYNGLGIAYLRLKRYPEALQTFNQALSLHRKTGYSIGEVETLGRISEAYSLLNQPQKAITYGKQSVNITQNVRRLNENLDATTQSSFLAQNRETYECLAALLVKANRLEEAEQVLRFLRQQDAFEFVRRDPKLAHELAALFQPLPYSPSEKKLLSPALAAKTQTGETIEESQLWQKALQQRDANTEGRTALLSTFNTDDTFYLLLTTSKTRRAFSVPIQRPAFDALTADLQTALVNPAIEPRPNAQKLYNIVFCNGQLEQALQQEGITTALWFTSGSLRKIPLDALYDGKGYLLQKPRINALVTLTSRRLFGATRPGVALAAGVSRTYTLPPHIKGDRPQNFSALSYVPQEVRSIVRDQSQGGIGPFEGQILLDNSFTADTLKRNLKPGVSTVHVATHFSLNTSAYDDSFLLMGDGKPLPVSQWKQTLQLQGVNLLTLSACETGVDGPQSSGGELSSIGELSQWLGAHSVIVSLWSVADESTSLLMSDFYKRWHRSPKQGKAEALRKAQLALLGDNQAPYTDSEPTLRGKPRQFNDRGTRTAFAKDPAHPYAHPFYWAPFSLIGDWK
ncbi:CHAT domain-containing protein, partial [bacterium]